MNARIAKTAPWKMPFQWPAPAEGLNGSVEFVPSPIIVKPSARKIAISIAPRMIVAFAETRTSRYVSARKITANSVAQISHEFEPRLVYLSRNCATNQPPTRNREPGRKSAKAT